jgi:hypothetical protein
MTPVSSLSCFGLTFRALPLARFQELFTSGASFSAPSSFTFKLVVIYEVTIRGVYDFPDYSFIWAVLDFLNKIVVRSGAWWRIRDDFGCAITPSLITRRPSPPNFFQKYHRCPSNRNLSSSEIGTRRCRNDLLGFTSPRPIKRLREAGEMPPRYAQASFSFNAPCLTVVVVSRDEGEFITSISFVIFFTGGIDHGYNRVTSPTLPYS